MEMWSVIEATTALFAFSLPAFKKFILRTIGTRPGDKVRPMQRVEDQHQQIDGGAQDLNLSGGTDSTLDPKLNQLQLQLQENTSGHGNTNSKKARGLRGILSGLFGGGVGNKKGSSKSRAKGKGSLPSFVRGSLVGGAGWIGPKVDSGGAGEGARDRRRRTLDDIELGSIDDYEDREVIDESKDKGSKTMKGAIQGASVDVLVAEESSNTGAEDAIRDESLGSRGTDRDLDGVRGL